MKNNEQILAEDIGGTWAADYAYHKSGNMSSRAIQSSSESFLYTGHQMTDANNNSLSYDENGNLTAGVDVNMVWNWANMLRSAEKAGDSISLRYDPSGNRIFKDSSEAGQRKYIVDIVGDLPVILLEIDDSNDVVKKTYIYANSQILAQHDGDTSASRYFYLHDRLGSVREVIDTDANVVRMYTYEPFGKTLEEEGTLGNPFMFTGQFYDSEIGEYYLRARMYDSYLSRFTSRDPVEGKFEKPLTLHKYLYCGNDPQNKIDASGLWMVNQWEGHIELTYDAMQMMGYSIEDVGSAVMGNIMTDMRVDHRPWYLDRGNIPHYSRGLEQEAEAHASGALELALWAESMGNRGLAMMWLGTGLHTIQDRWSHAEQRHSSWPRHATHRSDGMPDCDNPQTHRREYLQAYMSSWEYIQRFEEAREKGIFDLDQSGVIGDDFVYSRFRWDELNDLVEGLYEQGVFGNW